MCEDGLVVFLLTFEKQGALAYIDALDPHAEVNAGAMGLSEEQAQIVARAIEPGNQTILRICLSVIMRNLMMHRPVAVSLGVERFPRLHARFNELVALVVNLFRWHCHIYRQDYQILAPPIANTP